MLLTGSTNGETITQLYQGKKKIDFEEFQVNSYTEGSQNNQQVTVLADGSFVVTWVSDGFSDGQDDQEDIESGEGVYGQIFNPKGKKIGDEFKVNTYTENDQRNPKITALADGGFVITWQSEGQDDSGEGVYGQIFNPQGDTVNEEFPVNIYTENNQRNQQVTALADGSFVVTWQSDEQDGSGDGIYAQIFNPQGETVGEEFQVNNYTEDDQRNPKITALADGGFVITWQSDDQDDSGEGIYAQIFNPEGEKLLENEFQVNTYTENDQRNQQITALADGGFVITWQSEGQDGSGDGVYGQIFNPQGDKVGEEFPVNTYTENDQRNQQITALVDGGFVISNGVKNAKIG